MGCTGRYATVSEYDALLCAELDLTDGQVVSQVETYLDIAAADVHAALASIGACDCTLASWATAYLKKLNILDAAVIHNCPCGNTFDQDKKQMFMEWLNTQFELIRKGEIVLCQGETASTYPAVGIAELTLTEWNEAQIRINQEARNL